jgi:glutamate-1-semialdehyde 2,1-aminomutase
MVAIDESNGQAPLLMKSLLQQEMLRHGVLWSGFHSLNYSHTDDDLRVVIEAYEQALPVLRHAVETGSVAERLQGEPLKPVFRKTTKFHTRPRRAAHE